MASQQGRTSYDVTAEPLQVQLEAFLDEHRAALRGCLDGLTEEQARRRLVPSQTTLLGLVKHAAYAEQVWFGEAITGRSREEMGLPPNAADAFLLTPEDSIESARRAHDQACAASRRATAGLALDDVLTGHWLGPLPLRWVYLHALREFAQHCGHADILREQILSEVGDEQVPGAGGTGYSIRPAVAADAGFLGDMLVEATNWSAEWRPKSREHILSAADTAHYLTGWPRGTDLGVIAEADGQSVGAAWIRFLPETDPGYGFVAADVPELTIGVAAGWRGRGVGRALLRALASQARARGIGRISLSVERKNHAQRLYLSEGYRIVDSSDPQSDTMVKELG
ncbi:MAG TPA: GNAT family N-acetyltransferase [Streptosporangiaceae bacterium]